MEELEALLEYPWKHQELWRKHRALLRHLQQRDSTLTVRIAILNGSTASHVKTMLKIFLLQQGISPIFYESDYNRYYEEVMFDTGQLQQFQPDIIYFHTGNHNLELLPSITDNPSSVTDKLDQIWTKWQQMWEMASTRFGAIIIQNNLELPQERILGNLDCSDYRGVSSFVQELNRRMAAYAQTGTRFYIQDIQYLAAQLGLERWFDYQLWYTAKMTVSYEGAVWLARSLAAMIGSLYGRSRKCLITDLDNTLWGGVIGDDGLHGIRISEGQPDGEAFRSVQRYLQRLKERGILLAVCSKNEETVARSGFRHSDSILRLEDFSAFRANWLPKHENIVSITKELNIGLDSMVFFDDNPAERQLIRTQLPQVAVPELGEDPASYIRVLEAGRYFETVIISTDDMNRHRYYEDNRQRHQQQQAFSTYAEYLASLQMKATVGSFAPPYIERITQLINKTNQFNLTTRRYTQSEVETIAQSPEYITLYGRLEDKFGDNGLITALIARKNGQVAEIELWVMSCRVLKRSVEQVLLDVLTERCRREGIRSIVGCFIPTSKNKLVSTLYNELGFSPYEYSDPQCPDAAWWQFIIPEHGTVSQQVMEVVHDS